ncbi:MAG: efflux RND transporter permease subunit [Bacteroidetes bacterium]|nr:efflux RND transporter permease subunit [Bacteroidota bacterium]
MSLSSLSIKRPVLAIVMSIVIVLFGALGYSTLGVREYPAVDPPIITVTTPYAGGSADVIESQITEPLEESINGVAGIRALTSVSREGRSVITVEFTIDVDLETAANDVRDRVSRAIKNLPADADPPVIAKSDADQNPILFLTVQSNKRSQLEVNAIANDVFKERLQNVPGVSEVTVFGEKKYAIRVWLDPDRLAAYQLTALDVRNALRNENVDLPAGKIEGGKTELTLNTLGRLADTNAFNELILKMVDGRAVKLHDVGHAELAPENLNTILKRDGVPMIGVGVFPQPGANAVAISEEVYRRIEQIRKDIPPDIVVGTVYDTTTGIKRSISEVLETIAIAFVLVVLIIFAFLRNWRTTLIPVLAIPVSLVGTFFIMYLLGFSINILTLLGIVLSIGLVVDDAIVVLENIYSKIEQGMRPYEAGLVGAKEIFFAVVSTTVALVAVFMPVIFLQGLTGRLFREFGIVIAGSVAISAFVALTLTPMLSTRLIKHQAHGRFYVATEGFFVALANGYRNSLATFMRRRWLAPVIMVLSLGLIYVVGSSLQSELAPLEDRSRLRVSSTAPEGATFEFMDRYMDEIGKLIGDSVRENDGVVTIVAPGSGTINSGIVILPLKDADKRRRTQQQIADALTRQVAVLSGARSFVTQEPTIGDKRSGLPVQYVLRAPDIEKLAAVLPKFIEQAQKDSMFSSVDFNLKFNRPEINVKIDRDRARSLGVSVIDIAQTLQLAFSDQRLGYFVMEGKQYQVLGSFAKEYRGSPRDLLSVKVRAQNGDLIPLDNVVTLTEQSSPPQLFRYNRSVSATVSAGLAPGRTIGDGIVEMDAIAARTLDPSMTTALSGPARDYAESSSSILFAFLFALVLIYLVLAGQFESFRDPFIILLTVPLALAGALLSLWYFNQTLNIFSQIGIIMLIGLVTKNGILIVEFANQRKEAGLPLQEAIVDAAASRFRPILMTSLATILGTLPIALALGAGAGSRVSMGIAVIGGLLFSGGLTLYVIPAIYSYLSRELVAHEGEVPAGEPHAETIDAHAYSSHDVEA